MFTPLHTSDAKSSAHPVPAQGNSMPFFQPKLTVNTPGDAHEQEADRVADQVMRMKEGDAPVVQRMPLTPVAGLQRKCAECEKEEQEQVQRKETGSQAGGQTAPSIVSNVLASGGGQPMDGGTRQFMESRFGQDFGQVRIHTGGQAAESAAAIQARAYTSGRDVVFGQGEYQPGSEAGRRLLAHELAHVGQQENSEMIRCQPAGRTSPRIEQRFGLGMRNRFGLYDAELNRDTRMLTLVMRINFNFTGAWPSAAHRQTWIRDFISQVQNRWSFRFYLVPERICLNAHDTFFARVNVIPTAANAHYSINVNHTTSPAGSSANSATRTASLDSLDTREETRNRLGQDFKQRASEHEFGHMLGIPHIECDTTTGNCPAGDQYGNTIQERGDIMGSGWLVSQRDYTPFTTAMYYFTGCNWRASHNMVHPIGDYPATNRNEQMG